MRSTANAASTRLSPAGHAAQTVSPEQWADANGITWVQYPAQWELYGKSAGPRRNEQMLRERKPDGVVAFPGGVGTAHMVRIAKAAGVKVWEVRP